MLLGEGRIPVKPITLTKELHILPYQNFPSAFFHGYYVFQPKGSDGLWLGMVKVKVYPPFLWAGSGLSVNYFNWAAKEPNMMPNEGGFSFLKVCNCNNQCDQICQNFAIFIILNDQILKNDLPTRSHWQ